MTFFYMLPVATDDSLFEKTTFALSGQENAGPMHRAGFETGLEIIPYERPKHHDKFSIEIRGRLETVFEGRGYSEMWELLANNSQLQGPCLPKDNAEQWTKSGKIPRLRPE